MLSSIFRKQKVCYEKNNFAFHNIQIDVFKTLLRGPRLIRKNIKYFSRIFRNGLTLDLKDCHLTIHHHPPYIIHHYPTSDITRLAALACSMALRDPKGEHQLWVSKKWPLKSAKMSKFLIQNLNPKGYLSIFGAQNTPKSMPFETKNKAQTIPKQFQNNF